MYIYILLDKEKVELKYSQATVSRKNVEILELKNEVEQKEFSISKEEAKLLKATEEMDNLNKKVNTLKN